METLTTNILNNFNSILHFVKVNQTTVTATLSIVAAASIARVTLNDYSKWKAIGPGGLPYNPIGYMTQAALRLFAYSDTTSGAPYQAIKAGSALESRRFLPDLPVRKGQRPTLCVYVAPSRQIDLPAPPKLVAALSSAVKEVAAENPRTALFADSLIERGGPGLYVTAEAAGPKHDHVAGAAEREIFHVHESEGSSHAFLSAADAEELLTKGWGQRHPISGLKIGKKGIGAGYVTVWAPRSEEDIALVKQVAKAALAYATDGKAEVV